MSVVTKYYMDTSICIAFFHNVAIVDIGADIDTERMRTVEAAYRQLLQSYPAGIAAVVMMRAGTPVAAAPARAEGARFTKELGDLVQVAMVIEDRGIGAQMLRAVVRGINVLVRQTRLALYENSEQAVTAMARCVVCPESTRRDIEGELRSAVAQVREAFRPEPVRIGSEQRWF